MHELLLIVGGLVLLVAGGDLLVRGAARLAELAGVSPLVAGLTVVAFGTSAPELAVSLRAGLAGNDGIAVANVVGSNVFNVLFILGLCALAAPLVVNRALVRRDVPVMIATSVLAGLLALDGRMGRIEGLVLFAGMVAYTFWSIRSGGESPPAGAEPAPPEIIAGKHPGWLAGLLAGGALGAVGWRLGWWQATPAVLALLASAGYLAGHLFGRGGTTRAGDILHQTGFILAGLGALVLGADWLVSGAISVARSLGVGETVIGLTIVAAGTSLPEVAASLVATLRGQRDIAIGNVVGSNIANLLGILGLSAVIVPGGLSVAPAILRVDLPVMILVAVACLPVFYSGYLIRRWEGALFLAAYVGYTTWLVLDATGHGAAEALGHAMAWIFAPVTLAAFAASGARAWTTNRRPATP